MDNLEQRKIFARNLKRWMFLKDKTQMDLINDLGFPSSTLSQWATAKKYPRIDKVQMLADYFGILKSDLIEDKSKYNEIEDEKATLVAEPDTLEETLEDFKRKLATNDVPTATGKHIVLSDTDKATINALIDAQLKIIRKSE